MQITTASPAQIDTEIARLNGEVARVQFEITSAKDAIERNEKADNTTRRTWPRIVELAEKATQALVGLRERLGDLCAQLKPLHDEYTRRGGWSRYYLVNNSNGHIHPDTNCSTCNLYTQYRWLTSESGRDEKELVEDAGDRACTVCFPWAPVEALARASKFRSEAEDVAAARKAERDEKNAAKAAKAAAETITMPDGTPVRTESGRELTKEREVQSEITDLLASAMFLANPELVEQARMKSQTEQEIQDWAADRLSAETPVLERLLVALAIKRGIEVKDLRAELTKKATPKFRRNLKEAAHMRRVNSFHFVHVDD